MSARFYKSVFKIHSWLGLLTGLILLLVAVSGSLLVYYDELDKWLNRDLLTVEPRAHRLSLDSIVQIVRERYPQARGAGVLHFPEHDRDIYEFRLYGNAPVRDHVHRWDLYLVDMDPYTGRVIREGSHRDFVLFFQWIFTFHYSLHAGSYGVLILAIACFTLFASIITGVLVYRKYILRVLLFRVPIKWRNWRTATSDLHRVIGVWALVFNVLIFYSGLEMNWSGFDPDLWKPYEVPAKMQSPMTPLEPVLAKVTQEIPSFHVRYVFIPFTDKAEISVSGDAPDTPLIIMRGASYVSFNPASGAVTEVHNINEKSFGEKVAASTYSFHVGSFAGHFSRALYIVIGLTPGFLSVTGFMLWWRRKKFYSTAKGPVAAKMR